MRLWNMFHRRVSATMTDGTGRTPPRILGSFGAPRPMLRNVGIEEHLNAAVAEAREATERNQRDEAQKAKREEVLRAAMRAKLEALGREAATLFRRAGIAPEPLVDYRWTTNKNRWGEWYHENIVATKHGEAWPFRHDMGVSTEGCLISLSKSYSSKQLILKDKSYFVIPVHYSITPNQYDVVGGRISMVEGDLKTLGRAIRSVSVWDDWRNQGILTHGQPPRPWTDRELADLALTFYFGYEHSSDGLSPNPRLLWIFSGSEMFIHTEGRSPHDGRISTVDEWLARYLGPVLARANNWSAG